MSNNSNFREAIAKARNQNFIGPNVIANALPYVGGGLILTAVGTYGGLGMIRSNPGLFLPTFIVAVIAELILFFVASSVAESGNNKVALPLLATYSLLSGYTLSGLVFMALSQSTVGINGIMIAALGCGITFILAKQVGSRLSDQDGMALSQTVTLGLFALIAVLILQGILSFFGIYTPGWLEVGISGVGLFLFIGCAVVDFYILPRTYSDEEYLPAALSMYLTYINIFVFILRLLLAIAGKD